MTPINDNSALRFYNSLKQHRNNIVAFNVRDPITGEIPVRYNANQYSVSYRFKDNSIIRIYTRSTKNFIWHVAWGFFKKYLFAIQGINYISSNE
jgi:hypothetical protein